MLYDLYENQKFVEDLSLEREQFDNDKALNNFLKAEKFLLKNFEEDSNNGKYIRKSQPLFIQSYL